MTQAAALSNYAFDRYLTAAAKVPFFLGSIAVCGGACEGGGRRSLAAALAPCPVWRHPHRRARRRRRCLDGRRPLRRDDLRARPVQRASRRHAPCSTGGCCEGCRRRDGGRGARRRGGRGARGAGPQPPRGRRPGGAPRAAVRRGGACPSGAPKSKSSFSPFAATSSCSTAATPSTPTTSSRSSARASRSTRGG